MPGSLVLSLAFAVTLAAWGYRVLTSSDPSEEVNLAVIHALPTLSLSSLHRRPRR